jgi:hypothetical protein
LAFDLKQRGWKNVEIVRALFEDTRDADLQDAYQSRVSQWLRGMTEFQDRFMALTMNAVEEDCGDLYIIQAVYGRASRYWENPPNGPLARHLESLGSVSDEAIESFRQNLGCR